jgi:pyrophosphatase PpaX
MTRSDAIDTILFDLDGTLLDSLDGIRRSMAHVIARHAPNSSTTAEDLVSHVGRPLQEILSLLGPDADAHVDSLVVTYLKHNQSLLPSLNLFDGVPEMLQQLRNAGVKMGIVTSKRRDSTDISLRTHRALAELEVVLTSDDSGQHKPHPEPLLKALAILGSVPERSAYVGDAVVDIQAARAAGCTSVAALWGTVHRELLEAEVPDVLIRNPRDLLSWLP